MNIAIIGSGHTREIFDTKKNKELEDVYKVISYIPMISMLSLMSEPVLYNYRRMAMLDIEDEKFEHFFVDFEKNAINVLESVQPDVLLMDFYADARFGAMSYDCEYITNEISDLIGKGIIVGKNLGITYSYDTNTEDYIIVWKNYFDRFMAYIADNFPKIQIVINTMKMPSSYTDRICNYGDIEKINELWEAFDNYAIKKYNLKHIMKDAMFLIDNKDIKTIQQSYSLKFKKDYYVHAYKEFKNKILNIKNLRKKESHKNIIIDSAFSKDLYFWSNAIGKYEFVKYGKYQGIKVIDCTERLGTYSPQIWTRAIEIEGNGDIEYTLSFYITIPDINKLSKDKIVFRIRTFDNVKSIKAQDTVDWYRLTLEDKDIRSSEEYRYVFKFKPQGKYLKLAPFLTECVAGVEYNRIKLERSSEASEYSK